MSSQQPPSPGDAAGQPEYLSGARPRRAPGGGRRGAILAVAGIATVAVVGAGAWGVSSVLGGGGPAPATAVPADALGYLAVDLDPSASQKVEALQTLQKFPALAERLDLDSRDDLRRWLFEQVQEDGECTDLDFEQDIDPWLGNRIAAAVVSRGDDGAVPFAVVQVEDEAQAADGVEALDSCAGADEPTGHAFVGDYMVLAESQEQAEGIAAGAAEGSLADDADYQRFVDEAGDPGIITAYLSADAPAVLLESATDTPMPFDGSGPAGDDLAPQGLTPEQAAEMFAEFEGAAGVVRFSDGSVEAEFVAKGLPEGYSGEEGGDSGITELPASTLLALGLSLGDTWVQDLLDGLRTSMGEAEVDRAVAELEQQTGLQVPEDLQQLLGDGVTISLDASADFGGLLAGSSAPDPSRLPIGLRIKGDPAEITEAVDKLRPLLGPFAGRLLVEEGDGVVAVGFAPDYVEELSGSGELGDLDAFEEVVPDADEASGGLYVNFDVEGWLDDLEASLDDDSVTEVVENLRPLAAVGLSSRVEDDDLVRGLFKVTTD